MAGPASLPPEASVSMGRAAETYLSGVHRPDDRWIPLRPETLAEALQRDAGRLGPGAEYAVDLEAAIGRVVDQEARAFARDLDRRYDRFNPDRETLIAGGRRRGQRAARYALLERLTYLLEKANFERLEPVQLEAALKTANSSGMKISVRPDRIERLELYVRGQARVKIRVKTPAKPIKGEEREVDIYRRLAVIFQLKGDPNIALKMFREIPVADLESLLPHAEVEMNWLDRAKIIGGGAGALGGVASKVFSAVMGGAAATGNLLWVGIAALFGVSARSFFGYRRARMVRNSQMTHNLYYQNVANNAAVLNLLTGGIAAEELKEALLAYVFCASSRAEAEAPRREDQLDDDIEAWLAERFGIAVNFDCPDALETLDRLSLWEDRAALRVVDPETALRRLEAHWRERTSIDYHHDSIAEGEGVGIGTALASVAPEPRRRKLQVRRLSRSG